MLQVSCGFIAEGDHARQYALLVVAQREDGGITGALDNQRQGSHGFQVFSHQAFAGVVVLALEAGFQRIKGVVHCLKVHGATALVTWRWSAGIAFQAESISTIKPKASFSAVGSLCRLPSVRRMMTKSYSADRLPAISPPAS